MAKLSTADLEQAFDLLARAVDKTGPEQESLFLAKLALALADRVGDIDLVRQSVGVALDDINV